MCERLFSDRKGKNSLFTNEEPPTPLLFQPPLLLIYTKVSNPPYHTEPESSSIP